MNPLVKLFSHKVITFVLILGILSAYGFFPPRLFSALAAAENDPVSEVEPEVTENNETQLTDDESDIPENPEEDFVDVGEVVVANVSEPVVETEVITYPEEEKGKTSKENEVATKTSVPEKIDSDNMPEAEVKAEVEKKTEPKMSVAESVWVQEDGLKYRTTDRVVAGVPYSYPGDQGVTVTFTKLPANPGFLTIEKIPAEATYLENVASGVYDVTSDMPDGTFSYDLKVNHNSDADENLYLVTAESINDFTVVESASVGSDSVRASLNHFTYFAVVTGEDSTSGSAQVFNVSELAALQTADGWAQKSDMRWPLWSYDSNKYVEFEFAPSVPDSAQIVSAQLDFRYMRDPAGLIPWLLDVYGSRLLFKDAGGNWVTGADVWNSDWWSYHIHTIDLTPYVSTGEDLNNFAFRHQMYGGSFIFPIFGGMYSYYDWVGLNVEWVPGVPIISEPVSDNVLINSDSDSTQKIVGETEPNALVSLYIDGVLATTMIADGAGDFIFSNSTLASLGLVGGSDYMTAKSVTVTATSPDGHVSDPSRTIAYTKDTVSPTVPTLIYPRNNSYHSGDNLIADWTDANDPLPEASGLQGYYGEIYADSGLTNLVRKTSLLTVSEVAFPALPPGDYWWRVQSVDNAENYSAFSPVWKVTVDNTAPVVNNFSLSSEWVAAIDDLTFAYDVSDETELRSFRYTIWKTQGVCDVSAMNASGSPVPAECRRGEQFKRWRDDVDSLSGTNAQASGHEIDDSWKEFSEGTYFIVGQVVDKARNKTRTQRIWFGIDATPPVVPQDLGFNIPPGDWAIPHPDVEVACGDYTNANFNQTISHHWTDESASGAVEYERQWMYPGGNTWHGAEKWNTPYTNYRSFGGIPGIEGEWHVRVRARDAVGNWSAWSAASAADACAVTFDQTFPVVEITGPAEASLLAGTVAITGTISENIELSHYNLSLYAGDSDPWDFSQRLWQQQVNGNNSSLTHDLDTTAFPDGEYLMRLAARDKAGNRDPMPSSGDGVSVDIVRVNIDNTAPNITINNLSTTDTTPALSGQIDDPAATIVVTVAGLTYPAINQGNGNWLLPNNTVAPLVLGTHNVVAQATDLAGNVGVDNTTNELVITSNGSSGSSEDDGSDSDNTGDNENSSSAGTVSGVTNNSATGVQNSPVSAGAFNPRIGTALATGPLTGLIGLPGTALATGPDDIETSPADDNDGEIKGATDDGNSGLTAAASDQVNEGLLGLMKKWWFWVLVAIAVGILVWVLAKRRRDKDSIR